MQDALIVNIFKRVYNASNKESCLFFRETLKS